MFNNAYLVLFTTIFSVALHAHESSFVYAEEIQTLREAYNLNQCGTIKHVELAEAIIERELAETVKDKSLCEQILHSLQIVNKELIGLPTLLIQKKYCPSLFALIERLSEKAGVTAPLAFLAHNIPIENACASGVYNKNAGVMFLFSELFERHDDETIEAIIAHEIGHLKNNDTILWKIYGKLLFQIGLVGGSHYLFQDKIAQALSKSLNFIPKKYRDRMVSPLSHYLAILLPSIVAQISLKYISRQCESAADKEGLRLVDGNTNGFNKFFSKDAEKDALSILAIDDFEQFVNQNKDKLLTHEILSARMNIYIAKLMLAFKTYNLFRTHPLSNDRLIELDRLSREYKHTAAAAA